MLFRKTPVSGGEISDDFIWGRMWILERGKKKERKGNKKKERGKVREFKENRFTLQKGNK
jgi:hypothetical protein